MAPTSVSEPERADRAGPDAGASPAPGGAVVLEVDHETRYDYASPVSLAHHLAHLKPLADAHQALVQFALSVDPGPVPMEERVDVQGNAQHRFSVGLAHTRLRVVASSRVRVRPRFAGLEAERSPAWDALAGGLRYVARAPYVPAVEFALPSPYVPLLPELRAWAAPAFEPGRPAAEVAIELMHRLHDEFAYETASTDIDTPLARAFAMRRGVCQDFAHLLAGGLRAWGLPARYVSGYLLTRAPEDGHAMIGADASHAWVQVWCPGTPGVPADGWLDLDPTNDLVPGTGHVRVAVGRDYGDVAPLRGVIRGGGHHTLTVGVRTRVIAPPPASSAPAVAVA